MNKVLDACCLEVFCASGGASYNVESATVQILEGGDCIFGIFVIAGTNDNDVSACGECCVNAFFHCLEAEVVDNRQRPGSYS